MYSQTTQNIRISVEPTYLEEQSSPENNRYVWAYRVEIENCGSDTVQLRNRHWKITNANGMTEEVIGAGVIGKQPTLAPGERFEYTSGAPLPTPSGIMRGHYEMQMQNGERFQAEIPAFSLDSPHQPSVLN